MAFLQSFIMPAGISSGPVDFLLFKTDNCFSTNTARYVRKSEGFVCSHSLDGIRFPYILDNEIAFFFSFVTASEKYSEKVFASSLHFDFSIRGKEDFLFVG